MHSNRKISTVGGGDIIQDFKYEFDFRWGYDLYGIDDDPTLFIGYCHLHQFVKHDMFVLTNWELVSELQQHMEEGENVEFDQEGHFTLELREVTTEIVEYVKFLLKYCLILYKDFQVENNIIKFRRLDYEDKDN